MYSGWFLGCCFSSEVDAFHLTFSSFLCLRVHCQLITLFARGIEEQPVFEDPYTHCAIQIFMNSLQLAHEGLRFFEWKSHLQLSTMSHCFLCCYIQIILVKMLWKHRSGVSSIFIQAVLEFCKIGLAVSARHQYCYFFISTLEVIEVVGDISCCVRQLLVVNICLPPRSSWS